MTKVQKQATEDIILELKRQGKCFLAFHKELDPIMSKLVEIEKMKHFIASIV